MDARRLRMSYWMAVCFRMVKIWLVVWNIFCFSTYWEYLGILTPIDKYFSEGLKPPSRNGKVAPHTDLAKNYVELFLWKLH